MARGERNNCRAQSPPTGRNLPWRLSVLVSAVLPLPAQASSGCWSLLRLSCRAAATGDGCSSKMGRFHFVAVAFADLALVELPAQVSPGERSPTSGIEEDSSCQRNPLTECSWVLCTQVYRSSSSCITEQIDARCWPTAGHWNRSRFSIRTRPAKPCISGDRCRALRAMRRVNLACGCAQRSGGPRARSAS